jgi:hypothetical protein
MVKYIIVLMIAASLIAIADEPDTTNYNKWIPKGTAGFNLSQIAFSDWAQGGENSITYSLVGNFGVSYETVSNVFTNSLKATYGQTKINDNDFMTNDNEIFMETIFAYKFGWPVDPYISNTLRTSITPGYKIEDGSQVQVVQFFDPGYLTQSIGFRYEKLGWFKNRLGFAVQEIFANKFTNFTDDPDTPNEQETFKFETGLEYGQEIEVTVMENILMQSKLLLFTRFEDMGIWDVRWDNVFTAQVNKYINVNLNVILIHNIKQTRRTQVKEALQIGLVFNLF